MFWGVVTEALLDVALNCLPPEHLKACFTRILSDIRANRCGVPDLVQFWPAERRYRLIEVKGPGDRLQDNQVRWLTFSLTQGIPVSVCHVSWLAPDTRQADGAVRVTGAELLSLSTLGVHGTTDAVRVGTAAGVAAPEAVMPGWATQVRI